MKRILLIVAVLGVAGAAATGVVVKGHSAAKSSFRLVQVSRGDVEQTVSATGTLSAVRTVQVGTQVSGQIAELDADFNDHVHRGQVIARLDSTLLTQAVASAQTDLDRAQANVEQTRFLADQADRLHAAGSATDTEWRTALYNAEVAQASLRSAQIALQRARQNLAYAVIRAPIDGIVIERDVDVGQTVAASLQAPQLFLIAEDLRRMQILAAVDESDIGAIQGGRPVRFTVQAYPDRTFEGRVQQVRLQSKTTENVVNYTVVVAVDNADGALLPGMTATVTFEVAKAADALRVPNAALRFRPTAEMVAEVRSERRDSGDGARTGAAADSSARAVWRTRAAGAEGRPSAGAGGVAAAGRAGAAAVGAVEAARGEKSVATLWYVDAAGRPQEMQVRTGLTDGQMTEVTGAGVREGLEVIAGVSSGTAATATRAAESSTVNPFQSQQRRMGPPPGGM